MNLEQDFIQVSKLSKNQKKGLHRKWNTFFPEFKYIPTLRCAPELNYWRGCRWRPYSNCWGKIQLNYCRGYILPSPAGFGTPDNKSTWKEHIDYLCWLIDWLVHLYPPITRKRQCAMFWTNPHPLRSWPFSKLSCWCFDFFPRKFAACSKPPSRDNHRKASYPRTQQRD